MLGIIAQIKQGLMQTSLIVYSDKIKEVKGFKLKNFRNGLAGHLKQWIMSALNLHVVSLPQPTCMPAWMSWEVTSNYIIFEGVPRLDNTNEETIIRIFESYDFIIREFRIKVEEQEEKKEAVLSETVSSPDAWSRGITKELRDRMRTKTLKTHAKKVKNALQFVNLARPNSKEEQFYQTPTQTGLLKMTFPDEE